MAKIIKGLNQKNNGELKVKKYTPEEFVNEFKSLCDKMGYQLVATPKWLQRDDNTFSMSIVWSIGRLPKLQNQANIDKQQVMS